MTNKSELKRGLNLLDSTAIVIGSMIGSGIFIVSGDIARTVGSPGWLLIAWIISGIITMTAALSYGELAAMMPHAGGQYIYLREAYGKLPAFLYGWTLFTVIQSGTIAAVSIAFAKFTGVIFPLISSSNWIYKIGALGKYHLGLNTENLLAIFSIVFLTWINTRGLEGGKWIQNVFTLTKVIALLGLIIFGIAIGKNAEVINHNLQNFWTASWTHVMAGGVSVEPLKGLAILGALGAAMVGSLFSSIAWDTVTYTAGETINPKKNIPLSLALGTGTVILLYILINVVYLLVLPLDGTYGGNDIFSRGIQFASNDRVGTAVVEMIFGGSGAIIMALLIMISTFGCNNGIILSTARVYYAMAKDGLFFKKAEEVNEHSVPGYALLMQCIWSCLLCVSGTYSELLDYVIFAVLFFYVLTIIGLFILRRKRPDAERPYKAFGYPVIPALYILFALAISIDLLIYKPLYTWPGFVIVLLGIPVYYLWKNLGCNKDHKD
ncbi:MAG: amino acid permease [Candidatus Melainabacteria bacterium]|nr:amino acid permease [Candidatus Melainabacteria bacterium]